MLDARRGFGQAMAKEAMRRGIARAQEFGSVTVALRNSSHIGRIGHWAEQCAAAGMVSVHFVNVADHAPLQAPYGCSDARLGTNPFAAGVPGTGGDPLLLLDMATSAIAFGKARVARNKGVPVPEGALIDGQGRPTTDPTTYVDTKAGALLAFGAHKGSGLAILCEVLGAALTGGATIAPHHERRDGILNSMLSFILDPRPSAIPAQLRPRGRRHCRLGQGIAACPGLRRGPDAGRARAAGPRAPPRRGRADRRQEPRRYRGRDREPGGERGRDRPHARPLTRAWTGSTASSSEPVWSGSPAPGAWPWRDSRSSSLERAEAIGTETSARNSEVIHAGIYYPAGSLKARFCIAGKQFLYRYCADRGIAHDRCGKLIVATDDGQLATLDRIRANAAGLGMPDLEPWTADGRGSWSRPCVAPARSGRPPPA